MELCRFRHAGLALALIRFPPRHAPLLFPLALLVLTGLRLAVAAAAPLSPDEAYYWIWSRALAPGYLDHPPMVALWIRAGTWIAGDDPLGIRLLAPLAAAAGSLLLADAAPRLVRLPGAGLLAACLLNATLLFGIGAVTMTPDTPLLFFWVAAIAALARLSEGRHGVWFVVAGACIGLAGASKYTAAMLALGAGLWVLAVPDLRRRLAGPWPWLGTLAALVPLLPVLWWNAAHGWASFAKQGGRTADFHPARAAQFLAELVFGQAGLATPLVFAFCVGGLVLAARRSWTRRSPGWMLLAAIGLPPALLFLEHATGDRVQGNWPAIVYPAAAIAATGLLAPSWRRLRLPAIGLGLVLTGLVYVQAIWAPLPLPARRDPLALQLAGWQSLADAVEAARLHSGASFVATDQYGVAGELALDLPPAVPVLAVEARWALFALPAANPAGRPGLLVRSERHRDPPDPADWTVLAPAGTAARMRGGATVETYRLYLVTRRPGGTAAAFMPRP